LRQALIWVYADRLPYNEVARILKTTDAKLIGLVQQAFDELRRLLAQ